MTKKQYFELVEREFSEILELIKAKNNDYTGGVDDPFANFTAVEELGVCDTATGILTRLTDKFKRAISVIKKGGAEVKSETAEDTLRDIIGYTILLLGYLKSKDAPQLGKTVEMLQHIDLPKVNRTSKVMVNSDEEF